MYLRGTERERGAAEDSASGMWARAGARGTAAHRCTSARGRARRRDGGRSRRSRVPTGTRSRPRHRRRRRRRRRRRPCTRSHRSSRRPPRRRAPCAVASGASDTRARARKGRPPRGLWYLCDTKVILYCGVPTSSVGYSGHCTFAEPARRGVVGTVLAAAGEGEGGGQRVSARGPAQRAQTAKMADFSFARCARGQFFFARCARAALLRSHLSYLRRGDRSRASEGLA